jgi:eukaryotic-like serine/threonine-protein kinase
VPGPIAAVIDKCLAKDPGARWESAEALADALGKALDEVVTAERNAVSSTSVAVLSEKDAAAVWQRAAQLQAEAAHRMERSVMLSPSPSASPQDGTVALPTDTYRVRDVEAAAVEAGISRQFVAIALAEQSAAGNAGALAVVPLDAKLDRRVTTMLGTTDRSISVSRVIKASPKVTLQCIGRVFTTNPYLMKVRETVNGHPLDGGILRFEVANLYRAMSDGSYTGGVTGPGRSLIYYCNQLDLYLLNVTLKPRGTAESPECEVVITGDLRDGQRKNLKAAYWSIGGVTTGAVGAALPLGMKVLGALALASPVAAAAGALGAFCAMGLYREVFRRALRKAREELDRLLFALQQNLDSQALFGEPPPPQLPPRARNDDAVVAIITSIS